jgi:DNA-binding NarL/FixJ family response regulator
MDGREIPALIKDDNTVETIATVVLTTSDAAADIVKSYQLHANCYLTKPAEPVNYADLVKSISEFWLIKPRLAQQSKANE